MCGLCVKNNKGRSGCDVGNFAEAVANDPP